MRVVEANRYPVHVSAIRNPAPAQDERSSIAPVHRFMHWMELNLQDWQAVEKVTSRYAWQAGASRGQKILRIVYMIWDTIKHIFGLSDWRKAENALNRNMGTISGKVLEYLKQQHAVIRNIDQANRQLILSALLHRQFHRGSCHRSIANPLLRLLITCREKPVTAETFSRHINGMLRYWIWSDIYNLSLDKKSLNNDFYHFISFADVNIDSFPPGEIIARSQRYDRLD